METNNKAMNNETKNSNLLNGLSREERAALLAQLQTEEKNDRLAKRESYEALRAEFMHEVQGKVEGLSESVVGFKKWLDGETAAFTKVMREYGAVRNEGQQSYTVTEGGFKLEIKFCKVKGFDERADLAAERLVDYLKRYMERSEKGMEDPMYQMAMTLLERNKMGDLDYKSISKLYELEDKFDGEYADIMRLFKESNTVQTTATNYYFSKLNPDTGVWTRLEPSFCRL